MGKCFFILIYLIVQLPIHAQKNKYIDGLIITSKNDTIACLVQKRNWNKQPTEIKVQAGNKDTVVAPQEIKKIILPSLGLEYKSRLIRTANYVDKFQEATILKEPEYGPEQFLYLKLLYKGSYNLYLYLDHLNRKHFFVESPGIFIEIYSHYYLELGDSRRIYDEPVTVLDKQFEFALKGLMAACRTLFTIIENIAFVEEQLTRVFKMYDQCVGLKTEE
jgi:hypothetical protein